MNIVALLSLLILLIFQCAFAKKNGIARRNQRSANLNIEGINIRSDVSFRFAKVDVESNITNTASTDKEVEFEMRIPKSAFITNFSLSIGERLLVGVVKEKSVVWSEYEQAKEDEVTAVIVTQQTSMKDDFDRDIFDIRVNVAAFTTVRFYLQYQELIERATGIFSQRIYIVANQIVPTTKVTCIFREIQDFKHFQFKTPFDELINETDMSTRGLDGFVTKKIEWEPTADNLENLQFEQQLKPFEISYELDSKDDGGQIVYNEFGDFVLYFSSACNQTKVMGKHIVFVIDISGSMDKSVQEVRNAMYTILNRLHTQDHFNIILFSNNVREWQKTSVQATPENVLLARTFVRKSVTADGSTNINDALVRAINHFNAPIQVNEEEFGQIILFLSDGEATQGVTDHKAIRQNVRTNNFHGGERCCKASLFPIAFGTGADRDFLALIANENAGNIFVMKKSTEGEEDEDSLIGFFSQIQNPYYKNLKFTFYDGNQQQIPPENLTKSEFRQYDCGDEIIIGGWTGQSNPLIEPRVEADGASGKIEFKSFPRTQVTDDIKSDLVSRLVVYKRVKELLEKANASPSAAEKNKNKMKAIELSIRYNFVTPVTSIIITDYKRPYVDTQGKGINRNLWSNRDLTRMPMNDVDNDDTNARLTVEQDNITPRNSSTSLLLNSQLALIIANVLYFAIYAIFRNTL